MEEPDKYKHISLHYRKFLVIYPDGREKEIEFEDEDVYPELYANIDRGTVISVNNYQSNRPKIMACFGTNFSVILIESGIRERKVLLSDIDFFLQGISKEGA